MAETPSSNDALIADDGDAEPSCSSSSSSPAAQPNDGIVDLDESDDEGFMIQPTKRKRKPIEKSGRIKKIKINITVSSAGKTPDENADSSSSTTDDNNKSDPSSLLPNNTVTPPPPPLLLPSAEEMYATLIPPDELEDTLGFFAETHEEQDPIFQVFQRQSQKAALEKQLAALEAHDQSTLKEIDVFISDQMKSKQAAAERSLEKYKQRATDDEKRDSQRLYQLFTNKSAQNLNKIHQGMNMIRDRHTKEMHSAMQQHRQQGQQRHVPDHVMAQEWQQLASQLQAKQQRQLSDFVKKSEELKQRMAAEYKREQEKIRQQLESRLQSINVNRQKITAKLSSSFQQIRQRYIKRHALKMIAQKEQIIKELATLTDNSKKDASVENAPLKLEGRHLIKTLSSQDVRDAAKTSLEDKAEFRQPVPIKSTQPWAADRPSGASTRHKHRKTVMSHSSRQLSVEIHNEGLWVATINLTSTSTKEADSKSSDDKKKETSVDHEFIPWGVRAHDVLLSISCGEIPTGYDKLEFGEATELQGGQLRCVLTDLRTSEESAVVLRGSCVKEQEQDSLRELEKRTEIMTNIAAETEKQAVAAELLEKQSLAAVDQSSRDIEKIKKTQDEFMTKFRQYFGPDGKIIASNPNDRQKLEGAVNDIKTKLSQAETKAKAANQTIIDAKAKKEKLVQALKTDQKNVLLITNALKQRQIMISGRLSAKQAEAYASERASSRVKDVIGALKKAAHHRRARMNEKKSSNVSMTWLQSFPGLPTSLKKSLWHKMHRRKQQIVLRPVQESFVNDVRALVSEKTKEAKGLTVKQSDVEEQMVRAEQQFLLAVHPVIGRHVPTVPATKGEHEWAEPGCSVDLSVPQSNNTNCILPRRPVFHVFEKHLAEIASAPGRQAASLLRSSHFKCLSSPLSAVAAASSPAETGAMSRVEKTHVVSDPLYLSEQELSDVYTFSMKPAPKLSATSTRPAAIRKKSVTGVSSPEPTSSVSKPVANSRQVSAPEAGTSKAHGATGAQKLADAPKQQVRRSSSTSAANSNTNFGQRPPESGSNQRGVSNASESTRGTGSSLLPHASSHGSLSTSGRGSIMPAPPQVTPAPIPVPPHYGQFMGQIPVTQQPTMPLTTAQPQSMQQQFFPPPQPQQRGQQTPNLMTPQQRQIALQMMQQQQQQPPPPPQQQQRQMSAPSSRRAPPVPANFSPQTLQQMQQFYAPLNNLNAAPSPGHSQYQPMPPNMVHAQQQQQQQQQQKQQQQQGQHRNSNAQVLPQQQHNNIVSHAQQQQQLQPLPPHLQQQQQSHQQQESPHQPNRTSNNLGDGESSDPLYHLK